MIGSIRRIVKSTCVLLLMYPGMSLAQGLSLSAVERLNELFLSSAEWLNHYNEISERAEQFSDAARFAAQADQGERPTQPDSRWKSLVSDYLRAAKAVAAEPLSTDFDETPFIVDWRDWRGCHTREHAIVVLQAYSQALGEAASRGQNDEEWYAELMKEATATRQAVDILQRFLEKHMSDFTDYINMDWLALENQVIPTLADYTGVLQAKQKALARVVPLIRTRKLNLDGNLKLLLGADCSLAGTWAGTIVMEDGVKHMTMEIRGDPGQYNITYSIDGRANKDFCLVALNTKERRLDFRASCKSPASSLRFSLVFAQSFTSLTGMETDDTDQFVNFPIAMQRQ